MSDCLFCRIAAGETEAEIVAEDDDWLAFRDVDPQAPTHVLVIPRQHLATANDLEVEHEHLIGELVRAGVEVARDEGIDESGYRLVLNCNEGGGQSVYHLHLHVLGGRAMRWPPG